MRAEPVLAAAGPGDREKGAVPFVLFVSGPPGSGKTRALAEAALRFAVKGPVAAICAHESSRASLRAAIGPDGGRIEIDSLAGHAARWLRSHAGRSGSAPDLAVGSEADTRAAVRAAAADILDMTWPGFHSAELCLDSPLLARTDLFLDHASDLFALLRRLDVEPDEFEDGCAHGIRAFYGDAVENARMLCADPEVRSRASRRGRDALFAGTSALTEQKIAEIGLARVLAHLYREYRVAARSRRVADGADIVDEALRWLRADPTAAHVIAAELGGIVLDDAEDAEAGAAELLELLAAAAPLQLAIAGWSEAAIDGLSGKRSALPSTWTERRDPTGGPVPQNVVAKRFPDEEEETGFIASAMREILTAGAAASDIMLLCRDEDAASVYARRLAEAGLPVSAPLSRWQAPHDIADLLALAAIVADPDDEAHLLRVLSSPLVGLNDLSLWTLCRNPEGTAQLTLDVGVDDDAAVPVRRAPKQTLSRNVFRGEADHLLAPQARASVEAFRERSNAWRRRCEHLPVPAAIALLAADAGFVRHWHGQEAWMRARLDDDLRRLIEAAASRAMTLTDGDTMASFVRAIEDGDASPRRARNGEAPIACLSIIDAKGVRKPFVFVAGIAHERFPRVYVSRALAYSKKFGLITRDNAAMGASQSAKFAWYYAKFGAKALYLQEEARALDYGLKRATVTAYVTGFGKAPRWAADQDLLSKYGA